MNQKNKREIWDTFFASIMSVVWVWCFYFVVKDGNHSLINAALLTSIFCLVTGLLWILFYLTYVERTERRDEQDDTTK